MNYLAARPVGGTDVFVGDQAELAEIRWLDLALARAPTRWASRGVGGSRG